MIPFFQLSSKKEDERGFPRRPGPKKVGRDLIRIRFSDLRL